MRSRCPGTQSWGGRLAHSCYCRGGGCSSVTRRGHTSPLAPSGSLWLPTGTWDAAPGEGGDRAGAGVPLPAGWHLGLGHSPRFSYTGSWLQGAVAGLGVLFTSRRHRTPRLEKEAEGPPRSGAAGQGHPSPGPTAAGLQPGGRQGGGAAEGSPARGAPASGPRAPCASGPSASARPPRPRTSRPGPSCLQSAVVRGPEVKPALRDP